MFAGVRDLAATYDGRRETIGVRDPVATLLAAYDPEDIKPGWIALVIVVALAIATFLLWRSMNSQLRRIDVPTRAELAKREVAEGGADRPGSRGTGRPRVAGDAKRGVRGGQGGGPGAPRPGAEDTLSDETQWPRLATSQNVVSPYGDDVLTSRRESVVRGWLDGQSARQRHLSVSAAARRQPGGLVRVGEEAFAEARSRDVPILLSVGYAACHWCHVMAHESFEDEATAEFLNSHFVPVKVDREERPDIDAVYMEATQAMTGQGGWPMTVILTPSGEPFYAGTYSAVAESRDAVVPAGAHLARQRLGDAARGGDPGRRGRRGSPRTAR